MLTIYKQKGETPLQVLHRLKKSKVELASISLSYAGRLDPMAEGVMVVLVGEECKNREKYLGLDKTYVTEVLLGCSTDTADILGKVVNSQQSSVNRGKVERELKRWVGKMSQKYPAYSSKSFAGSYEEVREGKKEEIFHDVEIYSAEFLEMTEITTQDLLEKVKNDVEQVVGDFRQEEIATRWEENLSLPKSHLGKTFSVIKLRLSVSSGFYVRQFAEDFGQKLGVPALALSIVREKVGKWGIPDCVV